MGNIDKSISNDVIKKYFFERYKSIISFKIIVDQETKRSKGYGFIEFSDEGEFNAALNAGLNNKSPIVFGKQKLVFNKAKNRYDDDDVENSTLSTLNTSIGHSDSSNSINGSKKFSVSHFNDEELFQNDLQKGFRDIINIYNSNGGGCEPSNACNYYCNLNLIRNKNNFYNNFGNFQKVLVFNGNYFNKNNNNFYNNCNNNCNFGLNPTFFSCFSCNFGLKTEGLKKNLNQRKNSN